VEVISTLRRLDEDILCACVKSVSPQSVAQRENKYEHYIVGPKEKQTLMHIVYGFIVCQLMHYLLNGIGDSFQPVPVYTFIYSVYLPEKDRIIW